VRPPLSITLAAAALVAACRSDALLTAPPTPSPAARQPELRLVVIDSTQLPFAGTAADRAAGHYDFQIVGTVPAIGPGDYVAGRQGGLFLGRVVSASRSPGQVTLALAPAEWSEVYKPFKIHIPFTPGAVSATSPYGEVRWGPWERVSRPGQSLQVAPMASDVFDSTLSFLLSNFDLCAASGLVTGCANVTAKVIDAQFAFSGGVDLTAAIDFTNLSLTVGANLTEKHNASLDFQLTGSGSVEVDVPIPDAGFVRKFKVGPDEGQIEVGFIIGVEGDITGTTVEPHVQVSDTVTTGASVSTSSGFSFNYTGAGHFDAGVKVIDLGDLGVKLSVGPKIEVKLKIGDGGFALGAGADGFVQGTVNLSGLLGFENWHFHAAAGTEADLEGSVKVPLFGVDLGGKETFPGPGINLLDLWGTGDLSLASSTTGKDIFPGQLYPTTVARTTPTDPPPWYAVLTAALGVNDSHLFVGGFLCRQFSAGAPLIPPFVEDPQDCDLVATSHTVGLTGLAWNCSAAQALPAQVQVRPRNPFDISDRLTSLTLGVVCRSAYAVVRDRLAALLASGAINVGGIATALDAKLMAAETAREAGNVAGADSALVDLANQLRAQNGKHITIAADAELQAFDTLLRDCYETVVPTCSAAPAGAPVALRSGQ